MGWITVKNMKRKIKSELIAINCKIEEESSVKWEK